MDLRTRHGNETQLLYAGLHGEENGFLHIELANKEWFKGGLPKRSGKRRQLDVAVSHLTGLRGKASVMADRVVDPADLPGGGLIRAMTTTAGSSDVSLRMASSKFQITGTPYETLSWSQDEADGEVEIRLKGRLDLAFSDDYLQRCLDFIDEGFEIFVFSDRR
jgi:hypothetical protein